ncbi:hypothetical protein Y032_0260g508 [Ancylostoma ceylanicum]|uniref:Uncharacterized protein n=1 Tax=Ancylostoma ceylanicum TaxID=53326 RepID=A0A016SAZ7_9BILA|nr:hypothetical protein Y032_0260g508 [Ancylostoma ceylanicum]
MEVEKNSLMWNVDNGRFWHAMCVTTTCFHEISHADYTFSTPVVRSSLSWLKPSPRSMEFLGAWQALFQLTAQQYELLTEASTNIRGGKVVVI